MTSTTSDTDRLARQLEFVLEADRLKGVLRRSYVLDPRRRENSAEHSWHLSVMALVLTEHADDTIDLTKVLRMVIVHDLVEIDAGDTFIYDASGAADKAAREQAAAERLFTLLPDEQGRELRAVWDEFEAKATPEARFAAALDRLMPILHNFHGEGGSWREHGIVDSQVRALVETMRDGSETLWAYAHQVIDTAVERGYLTSG